jgi:hypothetical protein
MSYIHIYAEHVSKSETFKEAKGRRNIRKEL